MFFHHELAGFVVTSVQAATKHMNKQMTTTIAWKNDTQDDILQMKTKMPNENTRLKHCGPNES